MAFTKLPSKKHQPTSNANPSASTVNGYTMFVAAFPYAPTSLHPINIWSTILYSAATTMLITHGFVIIEKILMQLLVLTSATFGILLYNKHPYVDIAGLCFGTDGCAKIIVDTIRKMEESENE